MKKIIALALAVICVFSLASCKDKGDDGLGIFRDAIAATSLTTAKVELTQTNSLLPDDPLTASYDVSFAADGTAEVDFEYTLYPEIGEGGTPVVKTYTGSATIAPDGSVSGDKVSENIVAAATVKFNLDSSKMTYSVSKGAIIADIKAADTAAVLGVAVDCDVKLSITIANGVVAGATISYATSVEGVDTKVEIKCTYNK